MVTDLSSSDRPACHNSPAARRPSVPSHEGAVNSTRDDDGREGVRGRGDEGRRSDLDETGSRGAEPSGDVGQAASADGAEELGAASDAAPDAANAETPLTNRSRGLYVVIANDFPFFKVGSSTKLKQRLTALRWVMPGGMRLLRWWPLDWSRFSLRHAEIDLQARLGAWAVGGEWFRADSAALALIEGWHELPPMADAPDSMTFRIKQRRAWLAAHYTQRSDK